MTQINMIDSPRGLDPKRLIFAVIATSAILMIYSYFFAPVREEQVKEVAPVVEKPKPVEKPTVQKNQEIHDQATKADIKVTKETFKVAASPILKAKFRTSYSAQISTLGGVIDRYALTDFGGNVVLFDKEKAGSFLLSVFSKNDKISLSDKSRFEIVSADESHIRLRHVTAEGLLIERHYQFHDKSTISEILRFENITKLPLKVEAALAAVKSEENVKEPSFFNQGAQGQSIAIKTPKKYEKISYSKLKDEPKNFTNVTYIAFDDQFFLSAIIPSYKSEISNIKTVVTEPQENKKVAAIEFDLKPFILMNGEEKTFTHQFFLGPKQVDLLSSLATPLDENIDFGWFGVLSRPMLWLLVEIYGFVKNYGIAIILITFIIKLLTYPLTQKSFSSQQEMKKLQPKIKALQKKYSHDRTLLGQKQMELYREHGVNPVAGCLPLLIQLPIWFAFFQMLRNSVELFDQPFYFWIVDLTKPDPYFVLPVLMGASMLIQQAFTPPPAEQPQMKYVMWAMPIFLTFIMLNMPSGLSLYILTNNLLTIIQQLIIKRRAEKVSA